jgi:prepilin-type N-terminal cleavage/methylation domain-containing protein
MNLFFPQRRLNRNGFTVVEMMVVVAIIAVLAILLISAIKGGRAKAEDIGCKKRIHGLGVGLSVVLSDRGTWPNPPDDLGEGKTEDADEELDKWWIEIGKQQKIGENEWICPSEERIFRQEGNDRKHYSSYQVGTFDDGPETPTRWDTPWLMEKNPNHEDGQNVYMSTGAVRTFKLPPPVPNRGDRK